MATAVMILICSCCLHEMSPCYGSSFLRLRLSLMMTLCMSILLCF